MSSDFIAAPWQQPTSVASVLTVAPVEEPLSLDEAKLRAGLYWPTSAETPDPRDQMMLEHISAARQYVEQRTGLALLTQTHAVRFGIPDDGSAVVWFPLPMQALPLQSIVDATGQPIDPAAFVIDPTARMVQWLRTVTAPITIVSGWKTALDLKTQAPLLYQAVALLTAHYATAGRDLVSIGHGPSLAVTPYGFEEAIAPYCLVWVP